MASGEIMTWRLHFQSKSLYDTEVVGIEQEEDYLEQGGKFVAELLESHLPAKGFPVDFIVREDWGWCVSLKDQGFDLWVGCGYSGEGDHGLHCFVRPEQPRFWHMFKRTEVAERIAALKQVIESILRDSGQVSDLQWLED